MIDLVSLILTNPLTDDYDGKFQANPDMSFVSLMQGDKDANNFDASLTYSFESYGAGSQSASYQPTQLSTQSYNTGFDKMQELRGIPGWQVLMIRILCIY